MSPLEEKWRTENPLMFSHPEAMSGEVWIGDDIVDLVYINIDKYKRKGLPSARMGKPFLRDAGTHKGITHYPVFANLNELIKAEEEHAQNKQ